MLGKKKKAKCPAESKNLILINRFLFVNARCEAVKSRWSVRSIVHFVVRFCLSSWVSFEYTLNDPPPPPPPQRLPCVTLKSPKLLHCFIADDE